MKRINRPLSKRELIIKKQSKTRAGAKGGGGGTKVVVDPDAQVSPEEGSQEGGKKGDGRKLNMEGANKALDEANKKKAEAQRKKDEAAKKKEEAAKKKAEAEAAREEKKKLRLQPVMADTTISGDALVAAKKDCEFCPTGLKINDGTTFDSWQKMGRMLLGMQGAWQFFIGDWIRFGEQKFGEKYTQAVNTMSKEYSTLANCVYVCGKFSIEDRHPDVGFSVALAIAPVQDEKKRRELMKEAGEKNWTVKEARDQASKFITKNPNRQRNRSTESVDTTPCTPEQEKVRDRIGEQADALLTSLKGKDFAALPKSGKDSVFATVAKIVAFYKESH